MQNYKLFVFDHIDRKPHSNQISNNEYLKVNRNGYLFLIVDRKFKVMIQTLDFYFLL